MGVVNTLAWGVRSFDVALAWLCHVPISPLLKAHQAAHILEDSDAALLGTLHDRAASLGEADWRGTALTLEEHWDGLCAGDPIPRADVPPEGIAALLYTSGSTGRPKGVMVSHANLWLGAESVARYLELEAGDRVLALLPLSFDYGLNQMLSM